MVLSLAFILALVGSAIALLIGIVIFSEVSDQIEFQILEEFPQGCCPTPIPPDAQQGNSATGSDTGLSEGIYGLRGFLSLTAGEEITRLRAEVTATTGAQTRLIVYNSTNDLIGFTNTVQASPAGFKDYNFAVNPVVPDDGFVYIVHNREPNGNQVRWRLGTGAVGFPMVRHLANDFASPSLILFNNATGSTNTHTFVEIFVSQVSFQQPFTDGDVDRAQTVQFAKNTAFTVLIILPVALFFVLFSVFTRVT